MKKILIILCVLLITTAFTIPCFAEDNSAEEVTVFMRVEEFINTYTAEILSGGGILAVIGAVFVIWRKIKPLLFDIVEKIKKITVQNGESSDVQDKQSVALNAIMEGLEKADKKIEQYQKIVDTMNDKQVETTEHFKEIQRSLSTLARLFDTVYSNSKALPQGAKDMVHLTCAECIKIADHEIYGDTEGEVNEQQE